MTDFVEWVETELENREWSRADGILALVLALLRRHQQTICHMLAELPSVTDERKSLTILIKMYGEILADAVSVLTSLIEFLSR